MTSTIKAIFALCEEIKQNQREKISSLRQFESPWESRETNLKLGGCIHPEVDTQHSICVDDIWIGCYGTVPQHSTERRDFLNRHNWPKEVYSYERVRILLVEEYPGGECEREDFQTTLDDFWAEYENYSPQSCRGLAEPGQMFENGVTLDAIKQALNQGQVPWFYIHLPDEQGESCGHKVHIYKVR